jgi:chorismate mutase-like protein
MTRAPSLETKLHDLRRQVDELNRALLALLERRGELVVEIAAVKEALAMTAFDPRREEEMLRELVRGARGPYQESELREIFTGVFRAGLAVQERARRPRSQRLPRRKG